MDIIYNINDSIFNANTTEELRDMIVEFCTVRGVRPVVEILGENVIVHIDTASLKEAESKFNSAMVLANSGKYDESLSLLNDAVALCPQYVDAHRSIAQIYLLEQDFDKAIDCCIEALRWGPRDINALVLMGNIFSARGDIDSALNYYKKVLDIEPENALALNNVSAILLKQGKFDECVALYESIIESGKAQLTTYYGMALALRNRNRDNDLQRAFDYILKGILTTKEQAENPGMHDLCVKLMIDIANGLAKGDFKNVIDAVIDKIQINDPSQIVFKNDNSMALAAVLQYARSHRRRYHQILVNDQKPFSVHLKMHELMHLDMMTMANKEHNNKILFTSKEQYADFRKRFASYFSKLSKMKSRDEFTGFIDQLCSNLCLQLINGPLDLLVEDKIYNEYKVLRPLQLLSLLNQDKLNAEAMRQISSAPLLPPAIVSASKILNLVTSMHLKQLFGIDTLKDYKFTKRELDIARDMYDEYLAYKGYKPGEEYDLVEYFIDSVGMNGYLTFKNEDEFAPERNDAAEEAFRILDDITKASEDQPSDEYQDNENQRFTKEHSQLDEPRTMMMTMFMLGALEYFEGWTTEEVNKVAMDIAIIGMNGIKTNKESGYTVPSIPDKDMSGYQLIAYYYVSWAIAKPNLLPQLGLGMFTPAYEKALGIFNNKRNGGGKLLIYNYITKLKGNSYQLAA